MSMLAGPKYKQKISIDPRNKAWSDDSSKFGQRMLEKMGWSEGKGLGADLDGRQTHVKVTLKNNTLGLGCTPSHEDNWIAHQDDFNDILQSLNQNHSSQEGHSAPPSGTSTPYSLEERSKKSKSRVHYKRFTKGKDLSSRNITDIDSILGKRGSKSLPATPPPHQDRDSDAEEDFTKEFVTNKNNIQDYFAQKLANLKAERAATTFKEDKVKDDANLGCDRVRTEKIIQEEACQENQVTKKKKKKKKNKKHDEECSAIPTPEDQSSSNYINKHSHQGNVNGDIDCNKERTKKNKKGRKRLGMEGVEDLRVNQDLEHNGVGEIMVKELKSRCGEPKKKKREKLEMNNKTEMKNESHLRKKKKTKVING